MCTAGQRVLLTIMAGGRLFSKLRGWSLGGQDGRWFGQMDRRLDGWTEGKSPIFPFGSAAKTEEVKEKMERESRCRYPVVSARGRIRDQEGFD